MIWWRRSNHTYLLLLSKGFIMAVIICEGTGLFRLSLSRSLHRVLLTPSVELILSYEINRMLAFSRLLLNYRENVHQLEIFKTCGGFGMHLVIKTRSSLDIIHLFQKLMNTTEILFDICSNSFACFILYVEDQMLFLKRQ